MKPELKNTGLFKILYELGKDYCFQLSNFCCNNCFECQSDSEFLSQRGVFYNSLCNVK